MPGTERLVFQQSFEGLIRALGDQLDEPPHRMLERMTRNLRTGTNYLEARLEQTGPTRYVLTCRPVVVAGFYRGLFAAGLEMSGAKNPSVVLMRSAGDAAVYDLTWSGDKTAVKAPKAPEPRS
ncbi:MAG: DUF2378 family protein [Myxococcaceae bacterium]|nr:MAG: DUF2378 family protein [Myxococcaceae bacterium]